MAVTPLRERKAWQALERHYEEIAGRHLRDLFAEDPGRGERLTAEAPGLYLDYSKNRVTDETLRLLLDLAEESGVAERRDAMFHGEHINVSENRAVLHVALRMPAGTELVVDGQDVVADVHEVLGLLGGQPTERISLQAVRSRPVPFPPEPARTAVVQLTRASLARADRDGGRRDLWLRTLDRLGLGFDP